MFASFPFGSYTDKTQASLIVNFGSVSSCSAYSINIYLMSSVCINLTKSIYSWLCEYSHDIQSPCYIQRALSETVQTVEPGAS